MRPIKKKIKNAFLIKKIYALGLHTVTVKKHCPGCKFMNTTIKTNAHFQPNP